MMASSALGQMEMRQVEPVIANRLDRAIEPLGCETTAIVITGIAAIGPAPQGPDHLAAHLSVSESVAVVMAEAVKGGFLRVGGNGGTPRPPTARDTHCRTDGRGGERQVRVLGTRHNVSISLLCRSAQNRTAASLGGPPGGCQRRHRYFARARASRPASQVAANAAVRRLAAATSSFALVRLCVPAASAGSSQYLTGTSELDTRPHSANNLPNYLQEQPS
jgi:hypothetical protein